MKHANHTREDCMFDRLFGRKPALEGNALPVVRNVTLGRTVTIDLNEGGFVHRFYTDDDIMFQAVSNDRDGQDVTDVTLFAPWDSSYPSSAAERPAWKSRLKARTFTAEGLPEYSRAWFGPEASEQDPVTFWEELHDDRDGIVDRRIFQTCMLFSRDLPGDDGRELLLAIDMENEAGEVSFEIMLGVALELGEFRA
jgi:hypothetical protein